MVKLFLNITFWDSTFFGLEDATIQSFRIVSFQPATEYGFRHNLNSYTFQSPNCKSVPNDMIICPRTGSTEHNSKNSPCILIKTIVSCHCFPWNKSIQVCWSSTDSCWWLCNCNSATESRYNLFDMFCHKKRDTATWLRLEVPLPRTSTQRTWQRCTRRGKSWSHERVRAQAQAAQAHEALPKRQPKVGPSWKSCSLKI